MPTSDTYRTISCEAEGLFKDKGSRFIAYAYPVSGEDAIREHIQKLKKEHHSARHHCYAYRLGADMKNFRANDDGEPSNSAGKPILGQIHSLDLTNVLVVVVRYFGGTLLGVGGLIHAYREAAADVLANAEIVEQMVEVDISVRFEYPFMDQVMRIAKELGLNIIDQTFDMDCIVKMRVRKTLASQVYGRLSDIEGARVDIL